MEPVIAFKFKRPNKTCCRFIKRLAAKWSIITSPCFSMQTEIETIASSGPSGQIGRGRGEGGGIDEAGGFKASMEYGSYLPL